MTAQEHDADMWFATIRMENLKTDWEYRLARFHRLLGYHEVQEAARPLVQPNEGTK